MGWVDYHLHEFFVKGPITGIKIRIGIPSEEEFFTEEAIPGWKIENIFFDNTFGKKEDILIYN
jgi:hypothetical protein